MLGFVTEDQLYGWIPAPTELGALLGCFSGLCTVLVIGKVVHAPGGAFSYFWLPNGAMCSLCGAKTMITFIVTVISGGFFALLFSKLDVLIRGERARRPLLGAVVEEVLEEAKVVDVTCSDATGHADVEAGKNLEVTAAGDAVASG